MVSRRNIRIKAMQSIYALLNSTSDWSIKEGHKALVQSYADACELATAYFYIIKQTCEYSLIDASAKSSKRLPTAADLNVNTKIARNTIIEALAANTSFESACAVAKLSSKIDTDFIKRVYNELIASNEYQKYTENAAYEAAEDTKVFLYILNLLSTNESHATSIQDMFGNYEDDNDMVIAWINKNLEKISSINFNKLLSAEKHKFGEDLVSTFFDRYSYTSELIKPKLLNWDPERIAIVDMIIMQLGITEILYFPSIPCKVSINEYIDIAKGYSTMQSGQFVNGVLDKLYKELEKDNKIHKTDFQKK
jgi:transcription antitermination protein NusB